VKKGIFLKGLISFFVILSFMATSSYAANGIKLIGVGPVQRAVGGVSVGLPLDTGTTVTNPAGMTEVGGRVDVNLLLVGIDAEYRAKSKAGLVTANENTLTSDMGLFLLPSFGFIIPINDEFTFGIGCYPVSGIGVDYDTNLYLNVTYIKYMCYKLAPALSYNFNDVVILGAAPNFNYATLSYEAATTEEQPHHDGISYGIGFTASMLFKPLALLDTELPKDLITLGLAYESKQWFLDFRYNTRLGDDKLEFNLPQSISWGIGVKPNERFRIGADMSWINWSDTQGKMKPAYTKNSSNAALWNASWKDQLVYKIGGEYDVLVDNVVKKLTLRAGYNYGKHPLRSIRPFEDVALPTILEHHITCGAGVDITENIGVNIAFVYAPQITLIASNNATAEGVFLDEINTKVSAWTIDVGLTYKF